MSKHSACHWIVHRCPRQRQKFWTSYVPEIDQTQVSLMKQGRYLGGPGKRCEPGFPLKNRTSDLREGMVSLAGILELTLEGCRVRGQLLFPFVFASPLHKRRDGLAGHKTIILSAFYIYLGYCFSVLSSKNLESFVFSTGFIDQ